MWYLTGRLSQSSADGFVESNSNFYVHVCFSYIFVWFVEKIVNVFVEMHEKSL